MKEVLCNICGKKILIENGTAFNRKTDNELFTKHICDPENIEKEKIRKKQLKWERRKKRQLKKEEQINELKNARRKAYKVMKDSGKPILIKLNNIELMNRLWKSGFVDDGPYGHRRANKELKKWYRTFG